MKQDNQSLPEPTLLFIPDISGFTKFVHDTEAKHSQHIIEELLEVLIDANEIDLQISEIEGDAILFYRTARKPTAAEILAQVEKMYVKFHAHLKMYETQRICQCGACNDASGLALKFIIHYGDVSTKNVKTFNKLFGRDVIAAHRLLKNDVDAAEYVLITHQLLNACTTWVAINEVAWEEPRQGQGQYDFGSVDYCFLSLAPLRANIPEPTIENFGIARAKKDFEVEAVIEAPMDMVFDIVSDTRSKHLWVLGVNGSDQFNSNVTRNGSAHRCIMNADGSGPGFVSHGFSVDRDKVNWTDTNIGHGYSLIFTFQRIGKQLTRVNVTVVAKRNLFAQFKFNMFQKKGQIQWFNGSLANLNTYCKQLLNEGERPPANIVLYPESLEV